MLAALAAWYAVDLSFRDRFTIKACKAFDSIWFEKAHGWALSCLMSAGGAEKGQNT